MAQRKSKKSAKKKGAKKSSWGGKRPGAGRPKGTGTGPGASARSNRVAVMFSDSELKVLKRMARAKGVPVSTLAYNLCSGAIARNK